MLGSSQQPYRRYVRSVVGFFAFAVALFAAVNTWINPLWVTPAPWTDDGFAEWRPIYRQQRTAKAGLVRSETWNAAFFGSSRIDIAMDPALPEWGGEKVANLAVSAGTLPESSGILHYTIQNDPLKLAIVGIDLGDMLNGGSGMRNTGYMESPFNEKGDAFERELRYVVGISSFEASFRAITNRAKKRHPEYTTQGHRLRHQETYDVAEVIDRDSIPHAVRIVRNRRSGISPNSWKIDCFQRILDDTKKADCKLVVVLPPNHACYLGVYYYLDDIDPVFSMDRKLILDMIQESNQAHPEAPPAELWDFNDFHPLNCEAFSPPGKKMTWWLDGTHARKALGDIMLARIMDWPIEGKGSDYGVKLSEEILDQRSEQLRAGYQTFKNDHPDLWSWMVKSVSQYQK